MLDIVTFRWQTKGYRSTFSAESVNTLQRMVARHYPDPHRFHCVTDDSTGIDASIQIHPLWQTWGDVPSPHGPANPSCYRRLRLFSQEMAQEIGPRFVALDLDIVVTDDLRPLWNRSEDFVMCAETNVQNHFNGSMMLQTAGCRRQVYEMFDPALSPTLTKANGFRGTDQAWISFCLGPKEARWTKADGVYSYRNDIRRNGGQLPEGARVVTFHGQCDPWSPLAAMLPWVKQFYN